MQPIDLDTTLTLPNQLSRRRFLKRAIAGSLGVGAGLGVYAWRIEPVWARFIERDLIVPGLPAELHEARALQISDIHVGHGVNSSYLLRSFRKAAALEPDLVFYTGDFVSCRPDCPFDEFKRVIKQAPLGRRGTIGVLGNHDYEQDYTNTVVATELSQILGDHGIRILLNESMDVDGLIINGLGDLWAKQVDWDFVKQLSASERPQLTLCHNPDTVDAAAFGGYRGWALCGHTHGGQVQPPFLPPPILPVKNQRYTRGEFVVGDHFRIYINCGLGCLRRVRLNVRPEITVFRLRGA